MVTIEIYSSLSHLMSSVDFIIKRGLDPLIIFSQNSNQWHSEWVMWVKRSTSNMALSLHDGQTGWANLGNRDRIRSIGRLYGYYKNLDTFDCDHCD